MVVFSIVKVVFRGECNPSYFIINLSLNNQPLTMLHPSSIQNHLHHDIHPIHHIHSSSFAMFHSSIQSTSTHPVQSTLVFAPQPPHHPL